MPVRRAEDLARYLEEIFTIAAHAKFTDYDVNAVARAAPEMMYRLFDARVHLRNRISDFERRGLITKSVVQGLRDCFRTLRYLSDMLGEISIGHQRRAPDEAVMRGFTGRNLNTLLSYAHYRSHEIEFRSGDVVLVRGRAHNSAAIARIGDVDSQFSHIGIVYVDPDGRQWMVESLIEDGAIVVPLTQALDHYIVRGVLYRHKDQQLAARAAKGIHDYVIKSRNGQARRILYDFSMRLDENYDLFCSKLVRLAYARGSAGEFIMPRYPTRIVMRNRDFLGRIGIDVTSTFAPSDVDLESEFDLVAEWQDYRETSNTRLQDYTMDKIFQWMDDYNLQFEETPLVRLVSRLGRFSTYFSENAKQLLSSVFPRVPINMPRRTLAAIVMLHKTAQPVFEELQELEWQSITRTGYPMDSQEILAHLERIRQRENNYVGYLVPVTYQNDAGVVHDDRPPLATSQST